MKHHFKITCRLFYSNIPTNCSFWLPVIIFLFLPPLLEGATLQPRTAQAYSTYIEKVEQELVSRQNGELPYLRVSESPGNLISLSKNLIVIRNLYENDTTPKGIIHDWLGATVLKGISLDQALEVLLDYELHQEIFKEVVLSQILSQSADQVKTHMRFKKEGLLTVVTDSFHEAQIFRLSDKKVQIFSRSSRVNEIENYGKKNVKLLPEGNDRGLLWKINSYISLEESEDGVIIECRSINLTRDLPFGISLFIGPFIKNLPAESLESMLTALKLYLSEEPNLLQE